MRRTQVGLRRVKGQRRQCRIRVVQTVAERTGDREAGAVASGRGHRQAAAGDDHASRGDPTIRRINGPPARGWRHAVNPRAELQPDAAPAGQRNEPVAYVAGPVRAGKQLAALGLECQRGTDIFLEEAHHLRKRPRSKHPAQQARRRIGNEALGSERGRQHVAPAAATDQDLAAAVCGPLQQEHRSRPVGRGDCRHQAGCTGTDHDDWFYLKNSSSGTTRIGPRLSALMPGSIAFRSPTTTTAILSAWM